jgi:hypothetical protein
VDGWEDLGGCGGLAWRCQLREKGESHGFRTVKEHRFNFLVLIIPLILIIQFSLSFPSSFLSDLPTPSKFQPPLTTSPNDRQSWTSASANPSMSAPKQTQRRRSPRASLRNALFQRSPNSSLRQFTSEAEMLFYGCEKTQTRPWNPNVVCMVASRVDNDR